MVVPATGWRAASSSGATPRDTFLGFTPDGEQVSFAEHVFYRFDEGRIAAVSSLIDRWSIAAQLRGRARPSR